MSRYVVDIEGDGLLYEITKIHCIVAKDLKTKEIFKFRPHQIEEGLQLLSSADQLVGHNICGFDIPAIKKLYPTFTHKRLKDTLCMSKLFNPERFGGHSLESYGEQFKRAKPVHEDWSVFSEDMLYRCSEDVEINEMVYEYLVERYCQSWNWITSLNIEQDFAMYRAAQELEGVDIDIELAKRLLVQLDEEIAQLDALLYDKIPMRIKGAGNLERGTMPYKKDGTYNEATKKWIAQEEEDELLVDH